MGIDDLSHTDLLLGLGISSPVEFKSRKSLAVDSPGKQSEPLLTLSLSGGERSDQSTRGVKKPADFDNLYGQDSAASSFERVSSRASDEDDDGSNGRKKLRLTKAQSALLEESFKCHSTLHPKQKQELARKLKLRPRQVEVWFQNRRARTKLKQTEIDREFLKKCCESLTDENRRLQKELQELKSLKPPLPALYMQLPATTLTMCPSCERLGGAASAAADSAAPEPHMFKPFTNPSAAC